MKPWNISISIGFSPNSSRFISPKLEGRAAPLSVPSRF
jgi:hypothetical protein